uniref:Centrosomal protein of 97 kDa n=2 Tax=Lygus hesperus TaxID=30085 RepID=A0A0A9YI44_LYGHE
MSSCKSPEKSERYFPQFFQEGSTLDLCGQGLTKVPKHAKPSQLPKITQLLLDNNELHRFDNLHQYCSLIEFSASHNDLYRMAQVSSLKHLVRLDLSHNAIHAIDGLKDLVYLRSLNLAHNRLKIIDNLQTNLQLEELDLSGNSISVISNINQLSKLKKFYLHKNCISSLKHCGVYLPVSLETLTLAENKIADLNEISHLTGLVNLTEISIVANPCVQMTGNEPGFDHRPFLINWCSTLKVIDGYAVDDIECLKGEWLYSQGRGRQFRPGQHAALVKYLVEWCPLNNENLQTENERKLRLILSKAHQHQKQLRMSEDPIQPSTSKGKLHQNPFSGLMTQSLDPSLLDSCSQISGFRKSRVPLSDTALTRSLHCEPPVPKEDEPQHHSPPETAPLPAASKLVPVPESLISPMVTNRPPIDQRPLNQTSLAPQAPALSNLVLASSKLQNIRYAAESRRTTEEEHRRSREDVVRGHEEVRRIEEARKTHGGERDQAATCIQKMWRGYHTRNLNPKVLSIYHHLQTKRTNEYIEKLSEEMEQTRNALDSEHRLQILQMQAINALWKKVQRLQSSMEEVLRCVSPSSVIAMGTQTDIVAVHTPQETSRSQVPTFSAINTANPSTTSVTVCRPLSCWCSQRHC